MEKRFVVSLDPDLVIGREAAIDRMGKTAADSASSQRPHFDKQIQLVRRQAKKLCASYQNCRGEDWCWHCSSGQHGALFTPNCLDCKLLTADVHLAYKQQLVTIQTSLSVDLTSADEAQF